MQNYKSYMNIYTINNLNIFEKEEKIFLFGLFDGHNGPEISKYLSLHFLQFLSENNNFIKGDYKNALKETFINLDSSLRALEVQIELSKYFPNNQQNFSGLNCSEEENKNIKNILEFFEPRNLEGVNIAEFCGSSGLVVLITEKNVFIANSGNSRCIPINKKNEIIENKVNRVHTINDENEINRLKLIYGYIDNENKVDTGENNKNDFNYLDYCPLLTTRGFGNLQYKDNKLINLEDQSICIIPDIIEIPKEELNYLIIGNNSIFIEDTNNNESWQKKLAEFLLNKINNNDNNKKISEIIDNYFEEIIKEKVKNNNNEEEGESEINNMACIIIKFKEDNNNIINDEGDNEIVINKNENEIVNDNKELDNEIINDNNKNNEKEEKE